jgi:hypothetical protein
LGFGATIIFDHLRGKDGFFATKLVSKRARRSAVVSVENTLIRAISRDISNELKA